MKLGDGRRETRKDRGLVHSNLRAIARKKAKKTAATLDQDIRNHFCGLKLAWFGFIPESNCLIQQSSPNSVHSTPHQWLVGENEAEILRSLSCLISPMPFTMSPICALLSSSSLVCNRHQNHRTRDCNSLYKIHKFSSSSSPSSIHLPTRTPLLVLLMEHSCALPYSPTAI